MHIDALRALAERLPPLPAHGDFWTERRAEVRERLLRGDPGAFLSWAAIITTMFVSDAPYIREEWATLRADDSQRWVAAIQEDDFGQPERLPWMPESSGSLIHQAYHLHRWEQATGKRVQDMRSIVEVGGGYGAMAKVARRLGFTGDYLIVDLPEFSLLQAFYLSGCDVSGVRLCSALPVSSLSADLLIGLWSFSEMLLRDRNRYLTRFQATHLLMAYNDVDWYGVNNAEWFALVRGEPEPINHLPGNHYLFR